MPLSPRQFFSYPPTKGKWDSRAGIGWRQPAPCHTIYSLINMSFFDIIALDADDTLGHNESLFSNAQAMFRGLLAQYLGPELIAERLHQTEMRNIQHCGYGIKAFALSMIETALELTEGRVKAGDIQALIDYAKGMLVAEVELLEHVSETIPLLAQSHRLMVFTKGDPLDQE